MATTFFLIRHAAHDGPPGVLAGRSPGIGLSPAGCRSAAALAARMRGEGIGLLQTSPAPRCRQTAALLGPAEVVDALDEIDFGAWTGRAFATLDADPAWRHWNEARDTATAPGGEAMAAAQARAVRHLDALRRRHPDGRIALVSHADIIKAVVLHTLGLSLQAHARFDIDPASITTLAAWDGGGKLLAMNESVHPA